ncbi:hypothetical protein CHS0354_035224 [Potamilus streckersoni]|uniref:Galactose oxidase n=1 Tax=Potamilus streckersoni TaxID=2493646 RepID=A0AAE0VN93_9BIVA|nr:hypothetical protein CHS0354_035224 [Potamilus streckersoni]
MSEERTSEKNNLTDNFLPQLKKFLQNETVFGEPYKIEGITIIPVNSVKVGFAYGGSQKDQRDTGAGGGGVTLTPVAFLIVKNDTVSFQPISSDVWKSTDGKIWTEVTSDAGFPARDGHTTVKFKDELWVIGGFDGTTALNDVWTSPDGKKWDDLTKDAVFGKRYNHTTVVFDDGSGEALWVIGGYDGSRKNDVWKSADGENWEPVSLTGDVFTQRESHAAVVFKDALWVIGGSDGSQKNDVYKSADGKDWEKVITDSIVFEIRNNHTATEFDGALWVIGGFDGSRKNDVWKSTDGITWTRVTANAGFTAREGHTTVKFKDALWVIGGEGGPPPGSGFLNDVWKY